MKKLMGLALFLAGSLSACNNTGQRIENADSVAEMATEDTAVVYNDDRAREGLETGSPVDVDDLRENAPVVPEPTLEKEDVVLRVADPVEIYATEQDVMFETDKAQISEKGEAKLKSISEVIKNRIKGGEIRVYGFTDARASKEYNMELGRERAIAVENWLTNNAGFDKSRIKVISMGEKFPEATNATPAGRQQNRRIEIVVVKR